MTRQPDWPHKEVLQHEAHVQHATDDSQIDRRHRSLCHSDTTPDIYGQPYKVMISFTSGSNSYIAVQTLAELSTAAVVMQALFRAVIHVITAILRQAQKHNENPYI